MRDVKDVLPGMSAYIQNLADIQLVPYYSPPFDYFEYLDSSGVGWDFPMISNAFADCGRPVVDIACGWGRVALHLISRGHDVVAVDRSAVAIDRLTRLAGNVAAHAGSLEPVTSDALHFLRGRRDEFGGAVIGDVSINAFTGERVLRDLLASVHTALNPGARFVLSALKSRRLRQLIELDGRPFSVHFPLEDGRSSEMITALSFSEATGELIQNCYIPRGEAVSKPIFSTIREKMWDASEVRAMLSQIGFEAESSTVIKIPKGGLEGAEVEVLTLRARS